MNKKMYGGLFAATTALGAALMATGTAWAEPTPIGHWTFDEASSGTGTGTVLDSTAAAHHGTIFGSAVYVPGVVGTGALSFDGANDHVNFGIVPALDLTGGDYTIAFWLNYPVTGLMRIVNMDDASLPCSGGYSVFLSGSIRVTHNNGVCNDTGGGGAAFFPQPATGDWVHVAIVYDSTLQNITAYFDGIDQGSFSKSPPITPLTSDGDDPLRFGTYNGSGQLFQGSLDDVRIYDVALSEADVIQLATLVSDSDGDGIGDASDNCPDDVNPSQENLDGDALGDVCDPDDDNDGFDDTADNCPIDANVDQADDDFDGLGNACDATYDAGSVAQHVEDVAVDMVNIIANLNVPGGNGMITKLTGNGGVTSKVANAVTAFNAGSIDLATYLSELNAALDVLGAFDNQLAAKITQKKPKIVDPEATALLTASDELRSTIEGLIAAATP